MQQQRYVSRCGSDLLAASLRSSRLAEIAVVARSQRTRATKPELTTLKPPQAPTGHDIKSSMWLGGYLVAEPEAATVHSSRTAAWSTRRCWRSDRTFRIDYMLKALRIVCRGYEVSPTPAEVPTDRAPMMARIATRHATTRMRRSQSARRRAPQAGEWKAVVVVRKADRAAPDPITNISCWMLPAPPVLAQQLTWR